MKYELFCKTVRGSSHIQKETSCEDYSIADGCGEYQIFTAADGHGDPNCLRSDIGSQYICRIACENLREFACNMKEQGWEEKLFDADEREKLVRSLIRSIVGKWIEAVKEELEQNPLTEEEIQKAFRYAEEYKKGLNTERMYGTTLIAGLQTERYLLLLQQGDGRCVVFDSRGNAVQPIPWDDKCFGTVTTSLCDDDAVQRCRYHIIDLEENPVIACIAGTDGVEDSFPDSMEKTHAYYRDLLCYACENDVPALENYLDEELKKLSASGSADDITVSGIIDVERVRPLLDEFKEKNLLVELEYEVALLSDKVRSIEEGGKLRHLKRIYDDAFAEYDKAKKEYDDLAVECEILEKKIEVHEKGVPELPAEANRWKDRIIDLVLSPHILSYIKKIYGELCEKRNRADEKLHSATEKKENAEKEYLPCKERYEDFLQKKEGAIERLNKLKGKVIRNGG